MFSFDLFGRKSAAAAGVDLRAVFGNGQLALGLEFLGGAEAGIGFAIAQQPLGMFGVDVKPFRLAIGTVVPNFVRRIARQARAFVPLEAEPVQVLDQLRFVLRFGTLDVGVLDAEQEGAAVAAGEEPVVEGCPSIAHVQQPRW